MRRLLAAVLSLMFLLAPPCLAQNEARRIAFQDASNVFTGATNDFYFAGALDQPVPPTASQGATSGGSCTSAATYRIYSSYQNASGETQLSPPSIEFTPASGSSNIINVTRPLLIPDVLAKVSVWHAWFTTSADSHATTYACGASGAISDITNTTATSTCLCSTTTNASEPSANTTQNVYSLRIGAGAAGMYVTRPGTRTIDICNYGCQYTTLNAACSAETSTSSNPLIYYVHAGVYSSATQQTCSGEDYATIAGDGPSTRIINTEGGLNTDPNGEGTGDYGTIGMGTSTNWTIHDLYIKGHRAIYMDGNGTGSTNTGGGTVSIYNTVLETLSQQPNEDCGFFRDPVAGTEYRIHDNKCTHVSDGFTNISGATKWYVSNNVFFNTADTTLGQAGGAYAMQAIPTVFIDEGSTFILGRGKTGAGTASNSSHWFNGGAAAGGDGTECTSGCYAVIQSPVVRLDNTDSSGDGASTIAINISSTGAHLANLDVYDADVRVTTTDSGAGSAYGIYAANATTDITVHGGKWRTSGGATNIDFNASASANGQIKLDNVDYSTATSDDISTVDTKKIRASVLAAFGDASPSASGQYVSVSSANSPIGMRFENTDAVNVEASPTTEWCNSVAAGTQCWSIYSNSDDHFLLRDTTGARNLLDLSAGGISTLYESNFTIYYPSFGGGVTLGDGTATDSADYIKFDSANDAQYTWVNSASRMDITGATQHRFPPKASPPSSCVIGDFYVDTSGAVCFCTVAGTPGTWENAVTTGTCA